MQGILQAKETREFTISHVVTSAAGIMAYLHLYIHLLSKHHEIDTDPNDMWCLLSLIMLSKALARVNQY